ncbi:hypothetical protein, partial [Tenuibacillus multivorans]
KKSCSMGTPAALMGKRSRSMGTHATPLDILVDNFIEYYLVISYEYKVKRRLDDGYQHFV